MYNALIKLKGSPCFSRHPVNELSDWPLSDALSDKDKPLNQIPLTFEKHLSFMKMSPDDIRGLHYFNRARNYLEEVNVDIL